MAAFTTVDVVIDATINKHNRAHTHPRMAPLVVALGPGFSVPEDCHAIIETNRGHDLGRVIRHGAAASDTGIPGALGGETIRRVLRAPCAGVLQPTRSLGDRVEAGDLVARVGQSEVRTEIAGLVRGMAQAGLQVTAGLKIGDVDPRPEAVFTTISDKSRNISGSVLEVVVAHMAAASPISP
ncbi:putative molybdenum hydroxylase [Paratrimastix pyriformis]|uniref:Molybdenum hydroxylase n=1 Tax=Paratrimastix pyriformis TaxID=342808 RepID=A0ABQ8UIM2_9EUKA|nr:putative molybdenum hydroxylase [Paratrimastix pyriformis]